MWHTVDPSSCHLFDAATCRDRAACRVSQSMDSCRGHRRNYCFMILISNTTFTQSRYSALGLLALLLIVSVAGSVEQPSHSKVSNQDAAVRQAKEIASQVWEVVSPWIQRGVQWVNSAGREVFTIVYEKASFQGLKSVATEASRVGYNFFTGKPYQAAYQVAKDVPVVGSAVKDVIGEANLRQQAAREHVEVEKDL